MNAKGFRRSCAALGLFLALGDVASAQLELPRRAPAGGPAAGSPGGPAGAVPESRPRTHADALPSAATPADAARFVFEAVRPSREAPGLFAQALKSLAEIGPEALVVARVELAGEEPARLELAAATLCASGAAPDLDLVAERLGRRVPATLAERLLALYLERDPTRVTPELLTGLLDHPTGAMRAAAERELLQRAEVSFLPALERTLGAPRPSSRGAAAGGLGRLLVAGQAVPEVTELLVRALGDDTARVGWRAADLLAGGEASVEARLIEAAFSRAHLGALPAFDRRAAYALLALVEREDRLGMAILTDSETPLLLAGLASDAALVSGACAAALAGIGYRSHDPGVSSWLDRDVPHHIVKYATGDVFHADLTSLQGPCLRRLKRIAGADLGASGAAWQAWWATNAEGFHAERALLAGSREDAPRLLVRLIAEGRRVVLAGSGTGVLPPPDRAVALALSDRQAAELFERLQELGLLGAERPVVTGAAGGGRVLEIELDGARKRFQFSARRSAEAPSWFDRAEDALLDLARANRWQTWFDLALQTSALAFGRAEVGRWETLSPLAQERAFKDLVLARLARLAPHERDAGLSELLPLFARPGVPSPADYGACLMLLEAEASYGPRVFTLVELLLAAAAPVPAGEREGATIDATLSADLARLLADRFGEAARPALELVLSAAPSRVARALSADGRGWLRSLAGVLLSGSHQEEDVARALELARDADRAVAAATIDALGWNRVEEARPTLEAAVRSTVPEVRRAALCAYAELGGESARELALDALADPDAGTEEAAFRALVEVADPRDATLFAAHLARGEGAPTFGEAARAFRRLGDAGGDELARLLLSKDSAVRRQAALLLARRGSPEAVTGLLRVLSEDPGDTHVAAELAILSCRDLRAERDPARAWWEWWDGVVHDDAVAWLLAAAEQAGFAAPDGAALAGRGTRAGALYLLDLFEHAPFPISERARRELARRLGIDEARFEDPSDVRHEELLADIQEVFGS